jgi:hypothetical protein
MLNDNEKEECLTTPLEDARGTSPYRASPASGDTPIWLAFAIWAAIFAWAAFAGFRPLWGRLGSQLAEMFP